MKVGEIVKGLLVDLLIIVNHRRSPRIPHRIQPTRQKEEDTRRITGDCPLSLELGEGCEKRGRPRMQAG